VESHGPSLGKAVRPAPGSRTVPASGAMGAGACLRRGLGAGFLGGVASGLFLLVVGEPSMDEAIRLEHAAASGQHAAEEVFSRGQQHFGLILATGLYGLAVGGMLGILFFVLSRRMHGSAWVRSIRIALSGFAASFLVPFLKYPANPPGVGDPATLGLRTSAYLFLVAASVAACFVGLALARRLAARGFEAHYRQLIVGACFLVILATAFVALPPGVEPEGVPAGLLWDFRLASIGGQAVLWTGAGAVLGLLGVRAERKNSSAGESLPVTD
jgi:predicted cobalt transporter CbtA